MKHPFRPRIPALPRPAVRPTPGQLKADPAGTRLQKLLAEAGLGSRREIETWIEQGRISVNSKVARLGDRARAGDEVRLDGKPLALTARASVRVLAYHKPVGEIVTRNDPKGRNSVFERLPPLAVGKWVAVGRLDYNTSGLLLLTNSGELANRLMHPGFALEREYVVRVAGEVDEAMLARLRAGVLLDDGPAAFDAVREQGGSGRNRWFAVTLREGRNREVRRLWESQGCTVSRLKRVRFGPVALGPRERRGTWRELEEQEVAALCASVGLAPRVVETPPPASRTAKSRDRAAPGETERRNAAPRGKERGNVPPRGKERGRAPPRERAAARRGKR